MAQTARESTASNVRAILARRRISVRELASALGWPPSTAARKARGDSSFTVEELIAVAAFLDIPLSELVPAERVAS